MLPTLVLGSCNLLQTSPKEHIALVLATAWELGVNEIDAPSDGLSQHATHDPERLKGLDQPSLKSLTIHATVGSNTQGRCPLNRGQVWQSVEHSLQRLHTNEVDILFIHAPESETLLEQQAAAMDDMHRQGKIKRLGLANFSIPMLQDYLSVCRQHSYTLPSVYLLTYNLLWRFPESKLISFLRANDITLVVQSPLARGLLTGRLAPEQLRLDQESSRMYGKPCFHAAVAKLVALVSPLGITPAEASLRWVCWHSELGEDDRLVLGGKTVEQLRCNVAAVRAGPLPEELVTGIESIWDGLREGVRT